MNQLKVHLLWIGFLTATVLWGSWFFRYDQFDKEPWFFLDRWTGQLVIVGDVVGGKYEVERIHISK